MPSLPKKVPPPPKEPGTHTNAEVKEALHARALRRTVLVTAVVFLLLACLAVVSNTARKTVGDTRKPKMVMIVAKGLSPMSVGRALRSNKSPFMRLLSKAGGQFATIAAKSTANPLVNLLTGSATISADTLVNTTSILGWLKSQDKHTIVAAPSAYWSLGAAGTSPCPQVGLLDTECSGQKCPETKESAYCNAFRKYITCDDCAQLYNDEILLGFEKMINHSADALYFQLSKLAEAEVNNPELAVQERSEVNLLDSTVGRIALALSRRTSEEAENWLMIVTSDGANAEMAAPLLMVVYTKGELVQLSDIAEDANTADVANTIKYWFKSSNVNTSRLLGICTDGEKVENCKSTT
ncbi:protein of unknown function - conserved [Leishmania donovani]|uniref:Uncharacterized protein n=3 Tax=Leishmania donovani species complex TaxID=38574 RepID=A4I9W1_LEIIN|nr:conserved hypothetical protein [Leishmania infantum JPCM5]XP_003864321.1 hypothetical protein, conserved [Leishmania donovani]CAC9538018.1 hypothetical_protein_-_conserved [Leishmania infantum]AYU82500.1 hypothetical protein LdCL_340022200 [Leishmania donovani]TPP40070.1 hypothetical protein CGC21_26120 [Leishmania donovani]TPP50368.1 hypothetical protein CGC20_1710 [Leishmania donovani]CAJ1992505.1 protein of unknown function - conserved [Leishmania donovani]|eukprot:XP_001468530.1 conserved hypothetical protein [Leishmania infantum JPCM5]